MVTVYLTGPLYRGSNEDLHALERAKEIIEGCGDYRVLSIHGLTDDRTPEEAADKDYLFKERLKLIIQADLMVALDSYDQDILSKAEVNYLRAAGYQVMTMGALMAKHQQPLIPSA